MPVAPHSASCTSNSSAGFWVFGLRGVHCHHHAIVSDRQVSRTGWSRTILTTSYPISAFGWLCLKPQKA